MRIEKPTPIDEKIELNPERYFISSTDLKGIITSVNIYFSKISGYSEKELVKSSHNIVRHPDMPRIIFKTMWDQIQTGKNMCAVIKNLAKNGKYYWVVTDFEILKNDIGEPIGYRAFRRAAKDDTIKTVEPIYNRLLESEKEGGILASKDELNKISREKNMSYDDFINNEIKKVV
ncbi:PAS domain-containing protein [Campylobacter ureolyticus]|uniref:PAS domain-containing protein n=1 Tax=Campylobacter ureolyticus TaxID=827 RepID=UPI0022B54564|nr:PAS domain-containing protein [Campylobacter ureolyticus]MCZ6133367.1 PAS domain-containing protein [Campylobacter ureolyticus]